MGTVNYNCPSCAAPLTFNPERQRFCCEYCLSEFSPEKIQQIYAEREQSGADSQQEFKEELHDGYVFHCDSCGAEVVTTSSTAATTCFYCHNPVVMKGRLSGDFRPDRIIPFKLSREQAVSAFMDKTKGKKFLPKDFLSNSNIEKMTGVYFPYWYIDTQQDSHMTAKGKNTSTGNRATDDIPKPRTMTCSEAAMFTYAMFLKGRFHLPTEKCCSAYIRMICQRHSRFQCRTCRVFRQKKEI